MTTAHTDWDSERVGSVVYSIVDIDVTTGEGGQAWAICDRCGQLPLRVAYFVDGVEVQVIGSKCEPHVCPRVSLGQVA
jgi:hypothetical protein